MKVAFKATIGAPRGRVEGLSRVVDGLQMCLGFGV